MHKIYTNLIKEATASGIGNSVDFLQFKKDFCGRQKILQPSNADLRELYEKMIQEKIIRRNPALEKSLISRKIRTQSGVAVVAVLTKSFPCPGKCIYCPTEKSMPKSYLSNEPAVMRAIASQFDPYKQVRNRLYSLELNGHKTDKIELIVMGGTFSYLPKKYQTRFITQCFRACNDYGKKRELQNIKKKATKKSPNEDLLEEQRKNEKSIRRIVGLTLETRPDYINEKEIINFRKLGCTRVELGVQSIFNDVLALNRRGHDIEETIKATKILKDAGFKINYHIMPGLPGSDLQKDFRMFKELFSNQNFRPDLLKIYPTVILKNSILYRQWKINSFGRNKTGSGYKPLTDKKFEKFILKVKNEIIPPYVRIARLIRDIPTNSIIAGPTLSNLRQIIVPRSRCQCIRCREVRSDYKINEPIILDRMKYDASDGKEIFLQYVSPDKKKLFALLRLRIPGDNNKNHPISILRQTALIREVHTYGKLAEIDKKDTASPQHIGLGKKLMLEAEKIAREEYGLQKIAVISGIGVRSYYRKQGYRIQATYMVKNLEV